MVSPAPATRSKSTYAPSAMRAPPFPARSISMDNLPADLAYVPASARYRYSVGGNWQAWTAIPDDRSGTPFPLDGAGFSGSGKSPCPDSKSRSSSTRSVADSEDLTSGSIHNTGLVEISPYGLLLPIQWTDTVYGSIADTVWNDLNGNGIQEPGENGTPRRPRLGGSRRTTAARNPWRTRRYHRRQRPTTCWAAFRGYPTPFASIHPTSPPSIPATVRVTILTVSPPHIPRQPTLAPAEKRVDADFGYPRRRQCR